MRLDVLGSMDNTSSLTVAGLRRLLETALTTDEDLQKLILDGLGQATFQRLAGIQDRMGRVTTLLALYANDLGEILSALERLYPVQTDRFRYLLDDTVISSTETTDPSMAAVSPASISERSRPPIPPPGGAYDPAWHIPGSEEEVARDHLVGGGGLPVVLIGPEWFGKTWALQHILQNLDYPRLTLDVDLRTFRVAPPMTTYGSFLREFARQILVNACATDPERAARMIDEAWRYEENPTECMNAFLEARLREVAEEGKWLLLAIDNIDALAKYNYCEDFLTMLRAWMELANRGLPWSALRLIMTLSISARDLISNKDQSPFNIAWNVRLPDFSEAQVRELAKRHEILLQGDEQTAIQGLVGGHPYLLRLLFRELRRGGKPVNELLAATNSVYNNYLSHCARRLQNAPLLVKPLLRLLQDSRAKLDWESQERLEYAGFVVKDATTSNVRIRYRLYHRLTKLLSS